MQVFLRHGNDNKKSKYIHDHSLNLDQSSNEEDIITLTNQLIKKYGYPKRIYCSPFYRAIQTAQMMQSQCKYPVKLYIDPKLSRFFSPREQNSPSVRNRTYKYNPPIYEDKYDFYNRVDRLNGKLSSRRETTWYITHYLVMKRIASHHHITLPDHMPFLYTMPIYTKI
jgi:broad specificity phosphatase PhoE